MGGWGGPDYDEGDKWCSKLDRNYPNIVGSNNTLYKHNDVLQRKKNSIAKNVCEFPDKYPCQWNCDFASMTPQRASPGLGFRNWLINWVNEGISFESNGVQFHPKGWHLFTFSIEVNSTTQWYHHHHHGAYIHSSSLT
jgi:hypothetical protein